MKKTLLAIALAAATTTAYADTSVSGHVNYVIGDLEDFTTDEDIDVKTAGTSQSRFRFKASKEAGGITYGIYQELGLGAGGNSTLDKRVNELYMKGGFGKLTLGQGSEAGDGVSELDFSGTYVGNGAGYQSWGTVGISQIDGGRDERLRYDSPKLGPVSLAFDYDTNDDFSGAIKAGGSFWKAGVYFESREADDSDEVGGSVAFKFSGVTLAVQAGERDGANSGDDSLEYTKTIVGYNGGPFSVAVDFATNEIGDAVDHETTGVTFVYRPTKGVELYAGFRSTDDNDSTISLLNGEDSADGFLAGGRVKF